MNINNEDILKQVKLSRRLFEIRQEIITQQIITNQAEKEKVVIENIELQTAADKFRVENNLLTTADTMQWLEKHNLNLDEFEVIIYQELLSKKLAEHLFQDKVAAYFYEHQLDYQQTVIYEVVLDDFDLAMELFFGIQAKELSFWEVSRQYIREPELRRCGGYKGVLQRNELKPEISTAVFAAQPPEILKPIKVEKSTYLIFVEEVIQPKIDKNLEQIIIQKLYKEWLTKQFEEIL